MKKRLLLGAHISIAGGIDKSIERGESIFCTTMQIFVKNNRQWLSKPLDDDEIKNFKLASKKSFINPIIAHAGYLINLGSPDSSVVKKSIESLQDELQRCEVLEIPYLIIHPGSIGESDKQTSLMAIAQRINGILETVPGSTKLLLETMAGQGNAIGEQFEDLAIILDTIKNKKRIGVCFDTCHTWAAGIDFVTPKRYAMMWQQFDATIGMHYLQVLHLNDSKNGCGSHIDRHETIGKGRLGLEPFKLIMNDEQLFSVPKIIETPKESLADDLVNLKTLVNLITPETRSKLEIPEGLLS